jgi:UDPglucose 6-dehydrogenase
VRLTVIGTGYLGAVHAAGMASLGHEVLGVDVDVEKITALAAGRAPFFEPGLPELLRSAIDSGRLGFTTSLEEAADFGAVHFVCVGTPQQPGSHAADLRHVDAVITGLAPHLHRRCLVVGKSTVPVGTAARVQELVDRLAPAGGGAEVAWNPEFLREGFAVQDTLHPDRLVVGTASSSADSTLRAVYEPVLADGTPYIGTDIVTAELVKVSANAFLATKISFINAIAEICEATGGDVATLADALGHDTRIGRRFLSAGLGFGGGCLPKDIRAFRARAGELGADGALNFLREVDEINVRRRLHTVDLARTMLGGSVLNARIGVLGAAFKPDSDDVRDSPALNVAATLQLQGAQVRVHDPEAIENARRSFPTLDYTTDLEKAVEQADLVLHLTEWSEYSEADPSALARLTTTPRLLDARNVLDLDTWRSAGWQVRAIGRPRR